MKDVSHSQSSTCILFANNDKTFLGHSQMVKLEFILKSTGRFV